MTTDRAEFLGREGDASDPEALRLIGLSGAVDSRLDSCAVIQVQAP